MAQREKQAQKVLCSRFCLSRCFLEAGVVPGTGGCGGLSPGQRELNPIQAEPMLILASTPFYDNHYTSFLKVTEASNT